MMPRALSYFIFSFIISLCFQTFAFAGVPMCVRAKEATARPSKPFRITASIKKVETVTFDKYTPLSWTGKRDGKWLEVQIKNGRIYWVRQRDLSSSMKCLEVNVQKSQMYQGPGRNFKTAEVAARGDVFLDLGGEDGWTQVQNAQGSKAWIYLDHIWKPASKMRMSFSPDK